MSVLQCFLSLSQGTGSSMFRVLQLWVSPRPPHFTIFIGDICEAVLGWVQLPANPAVTASTFLARVGMDTAFPSIPFFWDLPWHPTEQLRPKSLSRRLFWSSEDEGNEKVKLSNYENVLLRPIVPYLPRLCLHSAYSRMISRFESQSRREEEIFSFSSFQSQTSSILFQRNLTLYTGVFMALI